MQTKTLKSDADTWREWLKSLPRLTGERSLTAIAKRIGLPPSTLTRPVKESDPGTSLPHQSTVNKILHAYPNLPPPPFRASAALALQPRGVAEDAAPFSPATDAALEAAVKALMAGKPNADPWVIHTRSLELAGYLPGDIVIVDLGRTPAPGDAVCAQTELDQVRGTAKTVMRIFERAGASYILMGASVDPALRAPIAVDERVAVMGVIVGMVRPLKTAA